jgi:excinuclease ABC subunit A
VEPETIDIKNAREHNLQAVSLSLPRNALIVFTGVSGSGKSSLAFDTLYAEGRRRYIESLSSYARQFMGQMQKPDCDLITGLSPAIAIQQKATGWNPRSTVGTITGIYDFLRVLYARVGAQHCTSCGRKIAAQSREQIVEGILRAFRKEGLAGEAGGHKTGGQGRTPARGRAKKDARPSGRATGQPIGPCHPGEGGSPGARNTGQQVGPCYPYGGSSVLILAPVARGQKGEFRDLFDDLLRAGYVRARVDGALVELGEDLALEKNQRHDIEVVIDRLMLNTSGRSRLAEAVEAALRLGKGTLIVATVSAAKRRNVETAKRRNVETSKSQKAKTSTRLNVKKPREEDGGSVERVFSSKYACPHCDISFQPPSPQLFSFNSPTGMCLTCDGLGELSDFDPALLVPDPALNFWAPCIAPMRTKIGRWRRHIYQGVARAVGFDLDLPWKKLPKKARDALLYGTGERHITYAWRWSGGVWKHGGTFEGVIAELRDKYRKAKSSFVRAYYEKFMYRGPCPDCAGGRLNEQALAVRLPVGNGEVKKSKRQNVKTSKSKNVETSKRQNVVPGVCGPSIRELCAMSVAQAAETIGRLGLTPIQEIIAEEVLKEVRARLEFLQDVGLEYLTLERTAPTLSGGEMQRIRLAGQIGSGLVGVLYILDEPSIGLHARDNRRLLDSLQRLRDLGNTVIVVEHDEATMRAADHLVDFGPGPGVRGGAVVASGTLADIERTQSSLTGQYLRGVCMIEVPKERRPVAPPRKRKKRSKSRG